MTLGAALLASQANLCGQAQLADWTVIERGPNQSLLEKHTFLTNGTEIVVRTNRLVHLATAMNKWESGQWVPSTPSLVLTNGGVLGAGGRVSAFFSDNANTAEAVQVKLPNGETLTSHVLGIAYWDPAQQSNIFVGVLRDSAAQVIGTDMVLYPNAFDGEGVNCSIRYRYGAGGVEQDLVWETRMAPPESFGLSKDSYLVAVTEIVGGPTPNLRTNYWPAGRQWAQDVTLDFASSMRMGPGKAFAAGAKPAHPGVPVTKDYLEVDQRRLVLERVHFPQVRKDIMSLPASSIVTNLPDHAVTNASSCKVSGWLATGHLPSPPPTDRGNSRSAVKLLASSPTRSRSFVMDYYLGVYDGQAWNSPAITPILSAASATCRRPDSRPTRASNLSRALRS